MTTGPDRALPPPSPPPWRPVRARRNVLAGVCAGLSVAAGVDVALVRLAFVVLGLSGVGILVYIVLALVLPREDPALGRPLVPAPPDTARWLRVGLIVFPILGVTGAVGGPWWNGPFFFHAWDWPGHAWRGSSFGLLLLLGGIGFIWWRRQHEYRSMHAATAAPASTVAPASGAGTATFPPPAWWEARPSAPTTASPGTVTEPLAGGPPAVAARAHMPGTLVAARVIAWLVLIGGVTTAALAVGLERIGALSIALPVLAATLSVAAVAVVIVAATRAHSALVVLASLLALAVPTLTVVGLSYWKGGIGDRLVAPTSLDQVAGQYRLAIGRLTLDLSQVPIGEQAVSIAADTRIGQLEVLVPDAVTVDLNAHVAAGDIQMFGRNRGGVGLHEHLTDTPTGATGRLNLDLKMATGQIRVCRASAAGRDCGGPTNAHFSFSS